MPSKPNNIIGNLRRKYEPHMKLEAKVDLNHNIIHGIDLKLRDLPKIHKTLSKSFGMQRKTLMRVLALEKKVAELEAIKKKTNSAIWGNVLDGANFLVKAAGIACAIKTGGGCEGLALKATMYADFSIATASAILKSSILSDL